MAIRNDGRVKVKLQLPGGKATPGQQVGQALGQHQINLKKFCDEFNEKSKDKIGYVVPVEITINKDKTFSLNVKIPPISDLIRKALNIEKGAKNSKTDKMGTLTTIKVEEIAKMKLPDLNTISLEAACKMVRGTARSMGVLVEG